MTRKAIGFSLIALGILIFLFFLLADILGYSNYRAAIGPIQLLGMGAGCVVTAIGMILRRGKDKTS